MNTAVLNARHAMAFVTALIEGGVEHAVVSPGARNTPLVLALSALRDRVQIHPVLDERTASFVGLGLARVSGTPVLLSCTSGTAGAHWLPAIVEASESGIPLLAITADRPIELHDCGAPQTVDQQCFFGSHTRAFFDLGEPAVEVTPRWLVGIAAQALDAAVGSRPGPVHINARFRKPLWEPGVDAIAHLGSGRTSARIVRGSQRLAALDLAALADELAPVERGVIVCGVQEGHGNLDSDEFGQAVLKLGRRLGWPVLAEPGSQVRFRVSDSQWVINSTDALLRVNGLGSVMVPDKVVRFGRSPVSKACSEWIENHAAGHVIAVSESGRMLDAECAVERLYAVDSLDFCERLSAALESDRTPTSWLDSWRQLAVDSAQEICQATSLMGWGGHVAQSLVKGLPSGAILHVASSLAIRDLDGFCEGGSHPLVVTCNRGANGIDGTLATAWGEALAWSKGPVAVLLGDLALLHDLGSLRALGSLKAPMPIVVLDNGGGGIFDYLPVSGHPTAYDSLFSMPQEANIPALVEASGVACHQCPQGEGLADAIEQSLSAGAPCVIHVEMDRAADIRRHQETWAAVAERVRPMVESLRA